MIQNRKNPLSELYERNSVSTTILSTEANLLALRAHGGIWQYFHGPISAPAEEIPRCAANKDLTRARVEPSPLPLPLSLQSAPTPIILLLPSALRSLTDQRQGSEACFRASDQHEVGAAQAHVPNLCALGLLQQHAYRGPPDPHHRGLGAHPRLLAVQVPDAAIILVHFWRRDDCHRHIHQPLDFWARDR